MTKGHHSSKPNKKTQLPTHLSHKKKTYHLYYLDRHEGPEWAREPHHNNPYDSKNLEIKRGIVHICLPGQAWPTLPLMCYWVGMERRWKSATLQMTQGHHYRSCATEWRWREDENRPPYKWPKPIIQANLEKQLNYQPTFRTKRKPVTCIIWMGTRGPGQAREPHHNNPYNSKNLERSRGIIHIWLLGWAWPTLPLMCYRVGMERRWKSATLQMT